MIPLNAVRCGRTDNPAPFLELRAGPIEMIFDPETAFLRKLRLGETEVLRAVYAALRDRDWNTILPKISNLKLERAERNFELEFDVECREREIAFSWHGLIRGEQSGTVSFAMDGEARSTFLRSRIGFCVLHPIRECAGKPCAIRKTDGSKEEGVFPESISPHQPFKNLRSITHEVRPGLLAEVRFEGETFEMEDQRNWSDASYKTYGTPLHLPLPVKVAAGTKISQKVTVSLLGTPPPEQVAAVPAPCVISLAATELPPLKLPAVGLRVSPGFGEPPNSEIEHLRSLRLAHLRLDLHPSDPDCADHFHHGHLVASRLGLPVEAAVYLSDRADAELAAVAGECRRLKVPVVRWLVFHRMEKSTSENWVRQARRLLGPVVPGALLGSGTDGPFVEVNRVRPPVAALDAVCYSLTPQVHAFDNLTLVENLPAQAWTARNCRVFVGSLPLAITPVTLKSRKHEAFGGAWPKAEDHRLPPGVDARQMSLFGAGWTLGSLKYLSESGVQSLTYYETSGWRGVIEHERGSPRPDLFPSVAGGVFPLYHVLADFNEFAGGEVLPSLSSSPERVECLALSKGGKTRVMLANLGPGTESVQVAALGLGSEVLVRKMDETNAVEAMSDAAAFRARPGVTATTDRKTCVLSLLPYSLVRIDTA